MKKLLVALVMIAGAISFQPSPVEANEWGGLCCKDIPNSCFHPIGMNIPESVWTSGRDTCTLDEDGEG
ncbi:hypothetical protein PBT90_18340 [Algoriphagus halophytocola]|uniref:Uncharacterized protein n=1 Tax=Algoriphagus halophytocola TaxID=2991499 RepID=A0ABY6MCP5_9BACT|nr:MULTISPECIES: hypothetical protein [unclassified Algoriphagus]UZD21477.1 hypothetical protein OM944_12470 [Algoriphagus sp. TR-M5]WBL42689.1 hypothetical protein PBT90_18340 [Algoriphagus sp. TR-M9]